MKPEHMFDQTHVATALPDEDRESLQRITDIRNTLDGHRFESRARWQWDTFLNTILEASMNLDFAPPKPVQHRKDELEYHDYDDEDYMDDGGFDFDDDFDDCY
jgi:hypothetical protein